jgi:hypothetical protein
MYITSFFPEAFVDTCWTWQVFWLALLFEAFPFQLAETVAGVSKSM